MVGARYGVCVTHINKEYNITIEFLSSIISTIRFSRILILEGENDFLKKMFCFPGDVLQ